MVPASAAFICSTTMCGLSASAATIDSDPANSSQRCRDSDVNVSYADIVAHILSSVACYRTVPAAETQWHRHRGTVPGCTMAIESN